MMQHAHSEDEDHAQDPTVSIPPDVKSASIKAANQQHTPILKEGLTSYEKARLAIAFIAAFLAVLSFIAFIISGNPYTLFGTSVLAYPFHRVIDYYFRMPVPPND